MLADEKVMPEKEPILALAEEKEIIGLMNSPAEEEPYITSTKNPFALLGELKGTGHCSGSILTLLFTDRWCCLRAARHHHGGGGGLPALASRGSGPDNDWLTSFNRPQL